MDISALQNVTADYVKNVGGKVNQSTGQDQ